MENKFELIFIIVNSGYEDDVMNVVREVGAKGGTLISATGTAKKDAEQFFGIAVHPDKEIILIVTESTVRDAVLRAVYDKFALLGDAQGIAFSLPISEVSETLKGQKNGEEKIEKPG